MPAPGYIPVADGRSRPRSLQPFLLAGLLTTLLFGPLAFGTTETWSKFIQCTFAVGLIGLWAAEQLRNKQLELCRNPIYLPVLLFGILAVAQFALATTSYA